MSAQRSDAHALEAAWALNEFERMGPPSDAVLAVVEPPGERAEVVA